MKKQKKLKRHEKQELLDQDENFYFIVDYTDGGAPYGITWEQYYDNIYEFTDRDYYYISEVFGGGEVLGITWKDYLEQKDKELLDHPQESDRTS